MQLLREVISGEGHVKVPKSSIIRIYEGVKRAFKNYLKKKRCFKIHFFHPLLFPFLTLQQIFSNHKSDSSLKIFNGLALWCSSSSYLPDPSDSLLPAAQSALISLLLNPTIFLTAGLFCCFVVVLAVPSFWNALFPLYVSPISSEKHSLTPESKWGTPFNTLRLFNT